MIERAIENWLINTNERNYQLPFSQTLINEGHEILYVSTHGQLEEGKDICSLDSKGVANAFQLKTGNINLAQWRIIRGEVQELIELPIKHPRVDKRKIHKAFLVANGNINDTVLTRIQEINQDNKIKGRRWAYLDVINIHELLQRFIKAQGSFIPKEPEDFYLFLSIYLADGKNFLPKETFYNILLKLLPEKGITSKSDEIHAITSAPILVSYLLGPYQRAQNYYALFEAWVILALLLIRFVHKRRIPLKRWYCSYNLILGEMQRSIELLKEEVLKRKDFLEGDWHGDGGIVYKARVTLILGLISAYEIFRKQKEQKYCLDKNVLGLIRNNLSSFLLWGEAAFPCYFNVIKFLELSGESNLGQILLDQAFNAVLDNNGVNSPSGLPYFYYDSEIVIKALLGLSQGDINFSSFVGGSYILECIVEILARRNRKDLLEKNWRRISHILYHSFILRDPLDIFLWRTKNGINHSQYPGRTQSWGILRSCSSAKKRIPNIYKAHSDLLGFILIVLPHRQNTNLYYLADR